MSVIPALFYMLQVEVHLRMREICHQICVTQKTIILIRNIQSLFYFIVIIVKNMQKNGISYFITLLVLIFARTNFRTFAQKKSKMREN